MDESFWDWIIDEFEADMHESTLESFNKRSSVTRRGGRPYSYSPREIGECMVKYFRDCADNDRPFTISAFCLRLGISRRGLLNLEKSPNCQFVHMIKKGKCIVEMYFEMQGQKLPNPAFPIFVLKNMGWK